jgi:hypothetical protein
MRQGCPLRVEAAFVGTFSTRAAPIESTGQRPESESGYDYETPVPARLRTTRADSAWRTPRRPAEAFDLIATAQDRDLSRRRFRRSGLACDADDDVAASVFRQLDGFFTWRSLTPGAE